jgi:mannose-6-phosphate isomerase-like protein (cupin superfamily)
MTVEILQTQTLQREWGTEQIVVETPTHIGKILTMKAGTKGGLQRHVKEEAHHILSGSMLLRCDDGTGTLIERVVEAGASWRVPPMVVHQEEAMTDVVVFEVGDPIHNDRERVEADYDYPAGTGLPSTPALDSVESLLKLASSFRKRGEECCILAEHLLRQVAAQ